MTEDDVAATGADPEGRITVVPRGSVLEIVIDRPAKLNAFSSRMLAELAQAYTDLESEKNFRCGVLLAQGRAFTAGLELDAAWKGMAAGQPLFPRHLVDPLALRPPWRKKPIVCGVKGICFTLGIELMLAADIVIAAEDTRFAQVEVRRGIMPIGGATMRMVERAGWGNAQRYLLTGEEFTAGEALRLGFVQEIVPVESLVERTLALAALIARQAPLAVQASLWSSRIFAAHGFQAAVGELVGAQVELMASADAEEGKQSFRERRDGVYRGK